MKFNEKLVELRKKAGLSQESLGEKLNVTRQTVSKWELGQTTPGMDMLSEMSKIFGVSVDELINEGDKTKMVDNEEVVEKSNDNNITTEKNKPANSKTREKIILLKILFDNFC